ncbi:MAG: T9SS type A sorting domain-containing protein [Taibaiella sp.]|jgi:hypothetical protein
MSKRYFSVRKDSPLFCGWSKKRPFSQIMLFAAMIGGAPSYAQSPGGVSTAAWYKADAAVYSDAGTTLASNNATVQQWNDQGSNGYHLLQVVTGSRPVYSNATTLANFNPTITFDGSNDWMQFTAGTGVDVIDRENGTFYAAGFMNVQKGSGFMAFNASMDYPGLHFFNNYKLLFFTGGPGYQGISDEVQAAGSFFTAGSGWQNGGGSTSSYAAATVSLDGNRVTYNTNQLSNANLSTGARDLRIGADNNWGAFSGQLNEVLVFEEKLTEAQMDQVESYLSIKYGTTYANGTKDYKNSTGVTVWGQSANTGFGNHIAGIARDNNGALYQKQSWSTDGGRQVLIGIGGLSNTNAGNTGTLTDGQYLIWGDNGAKKAPVVAISSIAGINHHFAAIWKVQNNGVGTVRLAWPKGFSNLTLIQSTDVTIDGSDLTTGMSANEVTVNGVVYNYADVTLDNGQYFTLGAFVQAPGGVTNGLTQWYRADKGVATVGGDSTNVTSWTDAAFGTISTQINTAPLPYFKEGSAKYFNFNPGVNFTEINQMIGSISGSTLEDVNFDIFTLTKEGMTGTRFFNIGMDNTTFNGVNWDQPAFYASGNIASRNNSGGGLVIVNPGNSDFLTDIPSIMYHKFTDLNVTKGLNGASTVTPSTYSTRGLMAGGHIFGANGGVNPPGGDDWGFKGNIGEVIIYGAGNLTAAERNKVDAYLAIKYGITLQDSTNYISAQGDTVWNAIANSTYYNNVAGIANDNLSALDQKQSISVNGGQQVLIGTTALANTNDSNTISLTDGQFLVWGDNGLAKSLGAPIAGITGLNLRFAAIWKVQNTENVQTVRVAWPSGIPNIHLVQSADETFDNTDVITDMSSNSTTINGVVYNYSDVTLSDGQYFTLAGYVAGPGGIGDDLSLWYKGDNGVVTDANKLVTEWHSTTTNEVTLTPNGVAALPYNDQTDYTSTWNFNPTVTFNGTNNYLRDNTTDYLNSAGSVHYIVVARNPNRDANTRALFAIAGNDDGFFYSGAGSNTAFPTIGNNYNVTAAAILTPNNCGIYSAILPKTPAQGTQRGFYNGLMKNYPSPYPYTGGNYLLPTKGAYIGADGTSGDNFNGDIAEVILYHNPSGDDMLDSNLHKIHSYLALKYGITLDQTVATNYINSQGNIVWDTLANTGYQHNIAGIARDDEGSLYQRQSWSINPGRQILISTTGLANTNAGNTGSLTNGQFLVWGDNDSAKSPSVPITGISDVNYRFASVWKVQNTNSIGTVRVAWPRGFANLKLIQSNDSTIDASDMVTDMDNTQAINGTDYAYADVTLADGQYFTFAAFVQAPGGVTNGILMWHKADDGVTTPGAKDFWQDISGNGRDVSQPNGVANEPLLIADSAYTADSKNYFFNYNPFYYFDGSNDFFYNQEETYFSGTTSAGSTYGVMYNSNAGGYRTAYGWGDDDPNFVRGDNNYQLWRDNGLPLNINESLNTTPAHIGGMAWRGLTNGLYINMNGKIDSTASFNIGTIQAPAANLNFAIGSEGVFLTTNGNEVYQGGIPEVFAYSVDHQNSAGDEKQRINSYLAIKYGITLRNENGIGAPDYLSSVSDVVYASDSTFDNNIAGIANDFRSALHQKQSRSANTNINGQIIIGLGEITSTNATNSNALNDGQFLVWGDNGNTTAMTNAVGTYTTFEYAGSTDNGRRMNRVWKIQNTNVSQEVLIRFPVASVGNTALSADACADYAIVYADDSTFATNVIAKPLTVNGTDYDAIHAFPNGTSYFTYARVTPMSLGTAYLPDTVELTGEYGTCGVGEWTYYHRTNEAMQNLLGLSGFTTAEMDHFDVIITPNGTEFDDGVRNTKLMPRITTVVDSNSTPLSTGKVRIYYSQGEMDATTVTGAVTNGWFRYSGNADDVVTDIYGDGVFNSGLGLAVVPDATGVEGGVHYVEFHNVDSFTFGTFVYLSSTEATSVVLPVNLLDFNLTKNGNHAVLSWTTASEQNNAGFEIERSVNARDWSKINFVGSKAQGGNSTIVLNYKYVDAKPMNGYNYYRLKLLDMDGASRYSPVRSILFNQLSHGIKVVPNPARVEVWIQGLNGRSNIRLIDVAGKVLRNIDIDEGPVYRMDIGKLVSGIYFIHVATEQGISIHKIVKQ